MPWYRDVWPWLLLLGALVLAAAVGLLAYNWLEDDEDGGRPVRVAKVPATLGLPEPDARRLIERVGYRAEVDRRSSPEPKGTVIEQVPEPGTEQETGEPVFITVSGGPAVVTVTEPPEQAEVPDAVGQDFAAASGQIEDAGLIADSYPVPGQDPRGTVVSQNPDPGTELTAGQRVRLNVSQGPGRRSVKAIPDVTGPAERDARDRAREAGFTVRTVDRDAPTDEEVGEVLAQEPAAGTRAPELTQITLFVGRNEG